MICHNAGHINELLTLLAKGILRKEGRNVMRSLQQMISCLFINTFLQKSTCSFS